MAKAKKFLAAAIILVAMAALLSIFGPKVLKEQQVKAADYDYSAICANYDTYWEEPSDIPMTDEFPSEDEIITWTFDEVESYVSNHYDLIEEYTIQWNRLGHIWNYVNDRETYDYDESEFIEALNE